MGFKDFNRNERKKRLLSVYISELGSFGDKTPDILSKTGIILSKIQIFYQKHTFYYQKNNYILKNHYMVTPVGEPTPMRKYA